MATVKSISSRKKGSEQPVRVRVALQPEVEAQVFYSNYLEVAHGPHDLTIYGARVPGKLNNVDKATATETGELQLVPDFQVVISPTLAPGLIRALQAQLDHWNNEFGKQDKGGSADGNS